MFHKYSPIDSIFDYESYWIVASPTFVKARLVNGYRIIQYWFALAFSSTIGYTWEYFWRSSFPRAFPEDFYLIFNIENASGGMDLSANVFCQVLHTPSLVYCIMFIFFPLWTFYMCGLFTLIWTILIDIFSLYIVTPSDVLFNYIDYTSAKYQDLSVYDYRVRRKQIVEEQLQTILTKPGKWKSYKDIKLKSLGIKKGINHVASTGKSIASKGKSAWNGAKSGTSKIFSGLKKKISGIIGLEESEDDETLEKLIKKTPYGILKEQQDDWVLDIEKKET